VHFRADGTVRSSVEVIGVVSRSVGCPTSEGSTETIVALMVVSRVVEHLYLPLAVRPPGLFHTGPLSYITCNVCRREGLRCHLTPTRPFRARHLRIRTLDSRPTMQSCPSAKECRLPSQSYGYGQTGACIAWHSIASHESNASKHPGLPRFVTHRKPSKLQAHRLAFPRKHPDEPVHTIRRHPRRGEPSFDSTPTPIPSTSVSLAALQYTRARHCGPRCMLSFWILQQS
jgi:hypothetical protein